MPQHSMRRGLVITGRLAAAGLLMGLLMLALLRLWLGPAVPVWPIEQRDFSQTLVASGRVAAPHRVHIGVLISGTVLQVLTEAGDQVRQGDPLLLLHNAELQAALALANSQRAQAALNMTLLSEVLLPQAEHGWQEASANQQAQQQALQRARELLASGFSSQALLDEASRAESVSRSRLLSATHQLQSLQPGGSQRALTAVMLQQATASVALAQARLNYATVLAPVSALVLSRSVEPGDQVQPGMVLLQLSPTPGIAMPAASAGPAAAMTVAAQPTELIVQIDEKHLHLLQTGQTATASTDAWPAQQFAAVISDIAPGIDAERGSLQVKLRVAAAPRYLRQDMTVSVDIHIASHPAALLLPAQALLSGEPPVVLRLDKHRTRRQLVTLGFCNALWCEVLAGLSTADYVVPAALAAALDDGQRIRARPVALPFSSETLPDPAPAVPDANAAEPYQEGLKP